MRVAATGRARQHQHTAIPDRPHHLERNDTDEDQSRATNKHNHKHGKRVGHRGLFLKSARDEKQPS